MITWGQLAKSQTDPEKIEEAIQRLVAEHNANPEAHLVEGGSLQSHKMAEIIDHLVRSIVADKFSDIEVRVETTFESVDGWHYDGLSPQLNWPGLLIHCGSVLNAETVLYSESNVFMLSNLSSGFLFQVTAQFNTLNNQRIRLGVGFFDVGDDGGGIGFETSGDKLYGVFKNWGNRYTVELMTINTYVLRTFRAHAPAGEGVVNFYVDGVLKGSLDLELISENYFMPPFFSIKNKFANTDDYLWITHLMIAKN
jgi:hypothetical protein